MPRLRPNPPFVPPPPPPPKQRVAYSVTDAAAAAGLSVSLLYELMKTGELAYVKIRARRLITAQALDELMARNVQGGGPEVA